MDPQNENNGNELPPTQAQPSPYRYAWQGSQAGQQMGNQFRSMWRNYTGQDANDDIIWNQYLNWDRQPDAQFQARLSSQMANSEQAQAYRRSQQQGQQQQNQGATNAPTPPPTTGGGGATGSPVTPTGGIPPPVQQANTQMQHNPVPQYQAPDQSAAQGQISALLQAILANPQTMNDNVVSQMKEAQKQQALLMGQQNQSLLDRSAVSRGTLGSGAQRAMQGDNLQQVLGQILDSNRNIDIQQVTQNRQDQLNALTAAEQVLNGQLGRANQNYGTSLQQWLAENNGTMDWARFFENSRQFNNTLGFNYNSLDQQGQLSMLQWLMGQTG